MQAQKVAVNCNMAALEPDLIAVLRTMALTNLSISQSADFASAIKPLEILCALGCARRTFGQMYRGVATNVYSLTAKGESVLGNALANQAQGPRE